jgi:hypothetical protein
MQPGGRREAGLGVGIAFKASPRLTHGFAADITRFDRDSAQIQHKFNGLQASAPGMG